MTSPTLIALFGFVSWSLALLVLMECLRTKLVMTKEIAPNGFNPENSNLSPFMQRLARAHANCVEGLPIFGGILLISALAEKTEVTDSLAYVFLGARLIQSCIHLISISPTMVTLRFSAFAVQMGIGVYWCLLLFTHIA
ncbi:MAG: MAPEG family protein [Oleiphilaceae bacterium]|nr:MAPEG family protein [Oleiphilaceae bacterium]